MSFTKCYQDCRTISMDSFDLTHEIMTVTSPGHGMFSRTYFRPSSPSNASSSSSDISSIAMTTAFMEEMSLHQPDLTPGPLTSTTIAPSILGSKRYRYLVDMVPCDQSHDLTDIANRDSFMDAEQSEDSSTTLPHNLTYTISSSSDSSLQTCTRENSSLELSQYTSLDSAFTTTSTERTTPRVQCKHRKKPINSLKLARQRSKSKMITDICIMTPNSSLHLDMTSTSRRSRRSFSKSLVRKIRFTKKNKCNS